jgi:hypothetical protein
MDFGTSRLAGLALIATGLLLACTSTPSEGTDGEPFCFLLKPHDVVGFPEAPHATQVTPDGAFNTGFIELQISVGAPTERVDQRIRTLEDGHLPILEYSVTSNDIHYRIQALARPHNLDPRENLINYVRVTATNLTPAPVHMGTEFRWTAPTEKYRAKLECVPWYCDRFRDSDVWALATGDRVGEGGAIFRNDHLVAHYDPNGAQPQLVAGDIVVSYTSFLAAGESRSMNVAFPIVPIRETAEDEMERIDAREWETHFAEVKAFWQKTLHEGMVIELDEAKVVDTMKASLAYNLIARDISSDGTSVIQGVGENMYKGFWPRDAAYMTRTYNMLGRPETAFKTLEHFLIKDTEGHPVELRRKLPDDWGQSLWAIGAHFRATGDIDFATYVYPAVRAHVELFEETIAADPLGLWPAAGKYDNEALEGHYTGHSFWALLGLREATELADALGETDDWQRFTVIHDSYRERFLIALDKITTQTGGYISPGLDDPMHGKDWANAGGGVYPFDVFDANDPRVLSTVNLIRPLKYQEGLLTYGMNAFALSQQVAEGGADHDGNLHHYLTMYLTQTLLAQGQQRAVLEDFYAVLAHTGSAHTGFEHSLLPWSNRDPGWNRPPHGWFAARYNELLRNMLLRETGTELHLLSALSPQWLAPGKTIKVQRGSTFFGNIDLTVEGTAAGALVTLDPAWRKAPKHVIIHIPFWVNLTHATVDEGTLEIHDNNVVFSPDARSVSLEWTWGTPPEVSYQKAVENLLGKYNSGNHTQLLF